MREYSVIVIGSGIHHNTLGVIRALGERGIDFELIIYGSPSKHYVTSSRYVHNYKAFKEPQDIIEYLTNRDIASSKKSVIISCADIITEVLNKNHSILYDRYIYPGFNTPEQVDTLLDKSAMCTMAKKHGINSPAIWALPADIKSVKYPCITKSYISSHGGKESVLIINTIEQLKAFVSKQSCTLFAQELVQKKEEIQLIGVSLRGGEEIIIPGMTKIIRSQPNTNTGFLEYGPIDCFYQEIVNKSRELLTDYGYSGLFSIEFIRDCNDRIYFLEINFRNDGNAWCVTRAGINLPVIWIKACYNEDYTDEINVPNRILMMPEFQDIKLLLQRKVSLFRWLKDWKQTSYFMEYDKQDKRPFFRYIIDKIR